MRGLNPFMNQVYFYKLARERCGYILGLNPFMNQVYFYIHTIGHYESAPWEVLIPL